MAEEEAAGIHLRESKGADVRVSWIDINFAIGIGPHDGNVVWWTRVDGGGKVVKGVGILVIRLMRRVRKVSRENEKINVPFLSSLMDNSILTIRARPSNMWWGRAGFDPARY